MAAKAIDLRRQGFSGPAMLPIQELEYGGITERLNRLDSKFVVREEKREVVKAAEKILRK